MESKAYERGCSELLQASNNAAIHHKSQAYFFTKSAMSWQANLI